MTCQPSRAAGRTDEAGLAAKLGVLDAGLGRRHRKRHRANVGADVFEKPGPAAIIPPPKSTISGSIVCISETAPDGQIMGRLAHQTAWPARRPPPRPGRWPGWSSGQASIDRSELAAVVASSRSSAA